jgi:hypothetical protein
MISGFWMSGFRAGHKLFDLDLDIIGQIYDIPMNIQSLKNVLVNIWGRAFAEI